MKLIILLLAIVLGFGAIGKKTVDDVNAIKSQNEILKLKIYPNLLPEVNIIAPRF